MNDTTEEYTFEYLTYITTLYLTFKKVFSYILLILAAFQLFCFIFFISKVFQKDSYFSTTFFYILYIGYGLVITTVIVQSLVLITKIAIIINVLFLINGYLRYFWGPWNTLMAVNRFTAIFYWKNFENLWNKKRFIFAVIVILAYPAFIIMYLTIRELFCNCQSCLCIEFLVEETQYIDMVSNGIHTFITAFLGIFTALSSRFGTIAANEKTKKFEKFMIFQSLFTILIMTCNIYIFVTNKISPINLASNPFAAILALSTSEYMLYFLFLTTIILFILSKTIRQSFIKFYFGKCLKKPKIIKISPASATTFTTTLG